MTEHHHLADGAEASSRPLFSPSHPGNGRLQGKSRPAISPPGSHGVCIYQSCWLPEAGAHIQPQNSPSAVALAAEAGRGVESRGKHCCHELGWLHAAGCPSLCAIKTTPSPWGPWRQHAARRATFTERHTSPLARPPPGGALISI